MKFLFVILAFLLIYSEDSDAPYSQESEKQVIDNLRAEIKKMADMSVCSDQYECFSTGIGAKPMGGPWEYIIYTGSIDLVDFFAKIETLNELEAKYNEKYMIQPTGNVVLPPKSIDCVDGKCIPIYD
jgi:hypothetical protein